MSTPRTAEQKKQHANALNVLKKIAADIREAKGNEFKLGQIADRLENQADTDIGLLLPQQTALILEDPKPNPEIRLSPAPPLEAEAVSNEGGAAPSQIVMGETTDGKNQLPDTNPHHPLKKR